jgi:hypothetical protein
MTAKVGLATKYKVCQTMASAGHYIASPACMTADVTSGRGAGLPGGSAAHSHPLRIGRQHAVPISLGNARGVA